jgi:hypothetical protein
MFGDTHKLIVALEYDFAETSSRAFGRKVNEPIHPLVILDCHYIIENAATRILFDMLLKRSQPFYLVFKFRTPKKQKANKYSVNLFHTSPDAQPD